MCVRASVYINKRVCVFVQVTGRDYYRYRRGFRWMLTCVCVRVCNTNGMRRDLFDCCAAAWATAQPNTVTVTAPPFGNDRKGARAGGKVRAHKKVDPFALETHSSDHRTVAAAAAAAV